MKEIIINLSINEDKNISIKNCDTNTSKTLNYSDKEIKAKDIYDVLSYEKNNKYKVNYDTNKHTEQKIKDYYESVIKLIQDIVDEVNLIEDSDVESKDTTIDNNAVLETQIN